MGPNEGASIMLVKCGSHGQYACTFLKLQEIYRTQGVRNLQGTGITSFSSQGDADSVELSFQSHDSGLPASLDDAPIYIMHGLLGSKSNWNSLAKAIHSKTSRQVVTVDARNHGDSPHADRMDYVTQAADLCRLFAARNHRSVTLMGHSMGGKTAMMLALMQPSLVSSLVVVDISPGSSPRASSDVPPIVDALLSVTVTPGRPQHALRRDADQQLTTKIPDKYMRQFLLTNLVESAGLARWRVNLPVIRHTLRDVAGFAPPPGATYPGPTLFIGGQNSPYIQQSAEAQQQVRALFPAARFLWVPGAGHWVHSEKPSEFLAAVSPFLEL